MFIPFIIRAFKSLLCSETITDRFRITISPLIGHGFTSRGRILESSTNPIYHRLRPEFWKTIELSLRWIREGFNVGNMHSTRPLIRRSLDSLIAGRGKFGGPISLYLPLVRVLINELQYFSRTESVYQGDRSVSCSFKFSGMPLWKATRVAPFSAYSSLACSVVHQSPYCPCWC